MKRNAARMAGVAALATVWAALAAPSLRAAEGDVRTFAIAIDGKPAGQYRMATKVEADGTETVSIAADVKVRILVVNYRYTLRCTEVWKGGQFAWVEAATNNDGKKTLVKATATEAGLDVSLNGAPKRATRGAIVNTGFRLLDPQAKTGMMFDIEDGSEVPVRIGALGAVKSTVNGQPIDGQRYKFTGKNVDAEWWFDAAGKPMYQSSVTDGHRVTLTLVRVER